VRTALFQCQTARQSDTFCTINAPAGSPTSVSFSANQGAQYALEEQFTLGGTAQPAPAAGSTLFVLNLADTAYFTIDPQTPGASYTTGSGINCASSVFPPVPEASTGAMLAAGLGILVWAARRVRVGFTRSGPGEHFKEPPKD
jgi:hypothetical protein